MLPSPSGSRASNAFQRILKATALNVQATSTSPEKVTFGGEPWLYRHANQCGGWGAANYPVTVEGSPSGLSITNAVMRRVKNVVAFLEGPAE